MGSPASSSIPGSSADLQAGIYRSLRAGHQEHAARRLADLNGDIFYYNYTGYQISEIVDRTAINNNYNAHVEGAEVEANWEPLPGLKFNFAGGWEDTAAAGGDSGIDLMDRTAGMPGWMVVKPLPTQASNCILPTYVVAAILQEPGCGRTPETRSSGACGAAYNLALRSGDAACPMWPIP